MTNIITNDGLYEVAKAAAIGTTLECPGCRRQFTKTSYQQAFCSNKGAGNCKDAYWNARGPRQRVEQAAPNVDTETELRALIELALPFVQDYFNKMENHWTLIAQKSYRTTSGMSPTAKQIKEFLTEKDALEELCQCMAAAAKP